VSRPTCRTLSTTGLISCTGLSPAMAAISRAFHYQSDYHVQAHPISLATTLGISVDLFSCSYLDVSVRRVRFAYLCIQYAMTCKGRVSPFGNLRIKVCLLTPRSLSQATTSFIACNRQGIHHVHLFACPYNVSSLRLNKDALQGKKVQRYCYVC
jgi:hypothetical protein